MSANQKPTFFKVLSNTDFTKLLRFPPDFFTRYDVTLPENVKLRCHDGRTWNVKAERLNDGVFCFTQGWPTFAAEAALQRGEFLVFTLLTKSKFDVAVFGTNFCEREIKIPNDGVAGGGGGASRTDDESSNPLYFEICLKPYHKARISLPVRFAKASGMMGRKSVMVEYVGGAGKSVVVDHRRQSHLNRFDLAGGWREFQEMNEFVLGKTYSFEFNPNLNLIRVNQVI